MKAFLIGAALFAGSVFAAHGLVANDGLVTNGGFETGDLSGWTSAGSLQVESGVPVSGGSDALVFSSSTQPNGRLSQTFGVIVGEPYQLSYDYAATGQGFNTSMLTSLTDANGHALVGIQVYPYVSGSAYHTFTAVFIATTPSMTLTFQDESTANTTRDGLLDNVQVVQIAPFSRAGNYVGTVVETGSFYAGNNVLSRKLAIKMQIDAAGRFFYLEAVSPLTFAVGTISDSGTATLGADGHGAGTATFHGTDIGMDIFSNTSLGENFYGEEWIEERKYSLHKVSAPHPAAAAVDFAQPARLNPGDR